MGFISGAPEDENDYLMRGATCHAYLKLGGERLDGSVEVTDGISVISVPSATAHGRQTRTALAGE